MHPARIAAIRGRTCQPLGSDYESIATCRADRDDLLAEVDRLRGALDVDGSPQWQVTVRVPLDLPRADRDRLFVAVSDAVALWEPQSRDGWNSCVYACPASEEGGT